MIQTFKHFLHLSLDLPGGDTFRSMEKFNSRWRHSIETLSVILLLYDMDFFSDFSRIKLLNKESRCRWFEGTVTLIWPNDDALLDFCRIWLSFMPYLWKYIAGLDNSMGMNMRHAIIFTNDDPMMTSSNGNIFRVTGHLCREFTGLRWIPRIKASDAEFWCFLWSVSY